MRPRFQFTLRRALLATSLVAAGMACWPIAQAINHSPNLPSAGVAVALIGLCIVGLFALPTVGISLLFSRTWVGPYVSFLTGAVVGVMAFVALMAHTSHMIGMTYR